MHRVLVFSWCNSTSCCAVCHYGVVLHFLEKVLGVSFILFSQLLLMSFTYLLTQCFAWIQKYVFVVSFLCKGRSTVGPHFLVVLDAYELPVVTHNQFPGRMGEAKKLRQFYF